MAKAANTVTVTKPARARGGRKPAAVATVGGALDALHTDGLALLAAGADDLRVVAITGSGTCTDAKVAADARWWSRTDATGAWALCYAVASNTRGDKVTDYQARGCRWAWANSYATAAADVARKSGDLANNAHRLRAGSVFAGRAYFVAAADVAATKRRLRAGYRAWVSGADVPLDDADFS